MSDLTTSWVGVDFGTISCAAAVLIGNLPVPVTLGFESAAFMPTAIYIEADGTILVGEAAVNARIRDPSRFRDRFKLDIGSSRGVTVTVQATPRTYSWEEVVAAVLRKIRRSAEIECNNGTPLTRITLTIPALYAEGGAEWNVMLKAASLAGFEHVNLLREPYAAAIYYDHLLREEGLHVDEEGRLTLVYDLGGGTFDPALIRRREHSYELVGVRTGQHGVPCGGILFDDKLRQDFKAKCPEAAAQLKPIAHTAEGSLSPQDVARARRRLRDVDEVEKFLKKIKHGFASPEVAEVNQPDPISLTEDYRLSRGEFYAMIAPSLDDTLESCRALMERAAVPWSELGRIVMVGGSCHIPLVREKLEAMLRDAGGSPEICWKRVGNTPFDPLLAVCFGAALELDLATLVDLANQCLAGNSEDRAKAFSLYRMAAHREHPPAERELGKCYERGRGVSADLPQALYWFERAALHGDLPASQALVDHWNNEWQRARESDALGAGEKEKIELVRWLRRAAELGDSDAQLRYDRVAVDERKAKRLFCSFCGKEQDEVRKLIAGPSVYICNECVELCNDIIREEGLNDGRAPRDGAAKDKATRLYCSFCGKEQDEVRKFIAGPSVFICNECIELCNDIIREEFWDRTRHG